MLLEGAVMSEQAKKFCDLFKLTLKTRRQNNTDAKNTEELVN